ncbi:uncharacterized protein RAG0_02658 [Rhynchosporium agropyri]|uniref:Uncharacterized protein n=1 Tax=Rhynchosporium agropyri TaxID=914238 RepID=A0A1E1K215_9HELO|nr:uncharacterized protein RAG0_02658 [Rhynchosporium agropyri]
MPPKTNLRGILRKDIRRNKITTAPLEGHILAFPKPVTEEANELDYLFDEDITESKENNPGSKPDSMSAKPIVKEMTMEQKRQEILQQFISKSNETRMFTRKDTNTESLFLKGLKKDLEELVTREEQASREEKSKLRLAKSTLIRKITSVEAEEKGNRAKQLKSNLDEFSRCLPACTSGEENTTQAKAEPIAKAFAGFEKTPSKRNRENTDNDLDGEERLRMGKSYKRPAMEVTGHWGMTVHDYFPDFEGNGLDRDALTAEEKLLNRRELAELGEALAKAERKKRLLEK